MLNKHDVSINYNVPLDKIEKYTKLGWVMPNSDNLYSDLDTARIKLIEDLELIMNKTLEERIETILSILDQLYGFKDHIEQLADAIAKQPKHVQAEIFSLLK